MSLRPSLLVLLFSLGALAAATVARAADVFPYPVRQQTLDNGLRVVVVPYDSPGIVAYFTVVRAGSRNEVEPGHSGFAHFFEHMMFRGTEKYPAERYNDVLKRMGADSNAFTTDDYTNYYIIGPAAKLETMMEIESDRFENLKYSENAFRTEALAILGEYNKNASSPFLPLEEKLRELAFQRHTYRHTTLGYLDDIKAMPGYYDYSLKFFDRFYRPDNVVLLVVGDVHPETVFALAKRYYGDWKRGYRAVEIEAEPPQRQMHEGHVDWPTPIEPHLVLGYHAPAFTTEETTTAALDLASQLLFSEAAPLYQELVVEKQWVDELEGGYENHRDAYLFTVFARVKSPELVPKVEAAIRQALADLASKPVDEKRLERTQSHLRYAFALRLDSPAAVAFTLASYLNLTGDPGTINRLYENYAAATPADIQRVAHQVFQPDDLTVVTLSHADASAPPPPASSVGARGRR